MAGPSCVAIESSSAQPSPVAHFLRASVTGSAPRRCQVASLAWSAGGALPAIGARRASTRAVHDFRGFRPDGLSPHRRRPSRIERWWKHGVGCGISRWPADTPVRRSDSSDGGSTDDRRLPADRGCHQCGSLFGRAAWSGRLGGVRGLQPGGCDRRARGAGGEDPCRPVICRIAVQAGVSLAPLTTLGIGGPAELVHPSDDHRGGGRRARVVPRTCRAVQRDGRRQQSGRCRWRGDGPCAADRHWRHRVSAVGATPRSFALARVSRGMRQWLPSCPGGSRVWSVSQAFQAAPAGHRCRTSARTARRSRTPSQTVTVLDRQSGEVGTLRGTDCRFGYRTSRFKSDDVGRFVVCEVTYELNHEPPTVRYPDLMAFHRASRNPVAERRRCPGCRIVDSTDKGHGSRRV